jgi:hypothetical protein
VKERNFKKRERETSLPAKSLAYASGYDQHHLQVAALVVKNKKGEGVGLAFFSCFSFLVEQIS